MGDCLGCGNQQTGEAECSFCHEHGRFVGCLHV
jgi:hypothetical protein